MRVGASACARFANRAHPVEERGFERSFVALRLTAIIESDVILSKVNRR
jgi:hypothetical protein